MTLLKSDVRLMLPFYIIIRRKEGYASSCRACAEEGGSAQPEGRKKGRPIFAGSARTRKGEKRLPGD